MPSERFFRGLYASAVGMAVVWAVCACYAVLIGQVNPWGLLIALTGCIVIPTEITIMRWINTQRAEYEALDKLVGSAIKPPEQ